MRKIRYIVMNKTKGTHEVAKSKTPKYVIDDDTQELLEIVMNWAQRHVDAQEDDDRFRDMNAELQELGDRFVLHARPSQTPRSTSPPCEPRSPSSTMIIHSAANALKNSP